MEIILTILLAIYVTGAAWLLIKKTGWFIVWSVWFTVMAFASRM